MCDCRPNYDRIGHDQYYIPEDQGPKVRELHEEIAYLRERVVNLEKMLGIHSPPKSTPKTPEKNTGYRQPGVRW